MDMSSIPTSYSVCLFVCLLACLLAWFCDLLLLLFGFCLFVCFVVLGSMLGSLYATNMLYHQAKPLIVLNIWSCQILHRSSETALSQWEYPSDILCGLIVVG